MADGVRRLSYADPRERLLFVAGLALALAAGFYVGYASYTLASSLGNYTSDEIYYVDSARRILGIVFHAEPRGSWPYSGSTDPDYVNPEHPPLGKYLIALSMVVCGDRPVCWRMPGIIEAVLLPAVLYIGYYAGFSREGLAPALSAGLAAAAAAGADLALRYAASVAMLDIHLAFFTGVAVAALAAGSWRAALLAAGLAASVKYSGFFLVPALWLYILLDGGGAKRRLARFAASIVVPVAVVAATWLPFALAWSPGWVVDQVWGALEWHTSSRPPGPPTSTPIGWLLNANPFYYSYSPMIGGIVTEELHVPAFVLAALVSVAALLRGRRAAGAFSYVSIIGGYLLLYAIGNRTLYSFYVVQLTPAMAGVYGDAAGMLGGAGACGVAPEGSPGTGGAAGA